MNWLLSGKEEIQFAGELVEHLGQLLPPIAYLSETKEKWLFPQLAEKVRSFVQGKKLNYFKRGKILSIVKLGLQNKGFGFKFIEAVTNFLRRSL